MMGQQSDLKMHQKLAETASSYWKMAYRIVVAGEDETFELPILASKGSFPFQDPSVIEALKACGKYWGPGQEQDVDTSN
jgi:hypothetical protein